MDIARFDPLSRPLAIAPSRRALARGLAALAIGGAAAAPRWREAEARSCGPCRRRRKGTCKPKPGSPPCGPCRVCQSGACKSACAAGEVCRGDVCLAPGGDCPAEANRCADAETVTCLLGEVSGLCLHTNDGQPFCAAQFGCAACLSDAACPAAYGPHRRCISACQFCNGGSACAQLTGDDA